jgi:hypothetical protein
MSPQRLFYKITPCLQLFLELIKQLMLARAPRVHCIYHELTSPRA